MLGRHFCTETPPFLGFAIVMAATKMIWYPWMAVCSGQGFEQD